MLEDVLGLQCTESAIRAATAHQSGDLLDVDTRAELGLPKGAIRSGTIEQQRKVVSTLRKLRKSLKGRNRRVSLCLSPQLVHTHVLVLPETNVDAQAEVAKTELSSVLPASVENYNVRYTPLMQDAHGKHVAVTAVHKDTLATYRSLCSEAGLSLAAITTSARALGSMLTEIGSFLLINAEDPEPSIVAFYGGHPVDELLLTSCTADAVTSETRAILQDFAQRNMPIMHVAIHGTKDLYQNVSTALAPDRLARTRRKEIERTVTTEHVLPELRKDDLSWGGVIAASLGRGYELRSKPRSLSSIVFQYFLIGIVTVALTQFVWTLFGGGIVEFWVQLQQMLSTLSLLL